MSEIDVSVVYALPDQQKVLELPVNDEATIEQVILQSGMLELFPEIDLQTNKVGIFGHVEPLDRRVRAGDRVEIYRPITCDPKEVRRQRAKKKNQADNE